MALNIFEAPEYYQGLLGEDATKKLQNRALTTGLVNAAIGYLAQPKTQGYGSALPYLGRALAGGLQAGQETIKSGLTDFETQQKLEQMKVRQNVLNELKTSDPELYKIGQAFPNAVDQFIAQKYKAKTVESPIGKLEPQNFTPESWAEFIGSNYDTTKLRAAAKPSKDTAFIQNYEYAVEKGYKGSPADWQKLNIEAAAQYQAPYKTAEQERQEIETAYKYGAPPSAVPAPKSATMQDVADTAKATGKTTSQVIQDLKSRGIKVQGAK
jgi:hypothetical protein